LDSSVSACRDKGIREWVQRAVAIIDDDENEDAKCEFEWLERRKVKEEEEEEEETEDGCDGV